MDTKYSEISCNIVLDSKFNTVGLHKVLFRLRAGRIKRDLAIGIKWPKEFYDERHQQLMPRYHDDPDVIPFNLKINGYKAMAHRLQLTGYLKENSVTIDDIVAEFQNISRSDDFFTFMEAKAKEAYNNDLIGYATWNRHKSSLNILRDYYRSEQLPVNKINLDFIERFDAYARKKLKRSHNTVCGYHKDIKKYLSVAVRKCLIAENPYKDFSFAYVDGDRQALTQEEVGRLLNLLKNKPLNPNEKEICRRFLFSCMTGLRISDTARIHRNMIIDNTLCFVPYKTRGVGKILKVPLQKIALDLIEGREGLLFKPLSDSYINETLKILAARVDIYKRLTYHCARDTFGTLFIEMTGNLKLLSDLMGHSSIKTTAIYTKMSEKYKRQEMEKFDELFKL
jgi:integrase/recombinase XerD